MTLEEYMDKAAACYQETGSLRKTALELGIAYAKVRKILITRGEYETDFSREVGAMRAAGLRVAEIADLLETSANRVTAFLPYEKSMYQMPVETMDAARCRRYRERIEYAKMNAISVGGGLTASGGLATGKGLAADTSPAKIGKPMMREEHCEIEAIPLHLELECALSEEERRIFRKYGHMKLGFTRQILIPSDMPLHNLHYAIQKLFGWQNSHLHSFELPGEEYRKLTGGMVKGWADLIGILFRAPDDEDGSAYYWDDDYEHGSFKTWLRTKYCGPYADGARLEKYEAAQEAGQSLVEWIVKFCDRVPYGQLTLEEARRRVCIESGTKALLERLFAADILTPDSGLLSPAARLQQEKRAESVTHELLYRYDYGDGWTVRIVRPDTPERLCRYSAAVNETILNEAICVVKTEHRPVCVGQDGMQLLDDVGGIHGFAEMLKVLHEGSNEKADSYLEWASGLGWNGRRVSNRLLL